MDKFDNLPLFGGKLEKLGRKRPKRKKGRRKKLKKLKKKGFGVVGLPLFSWYVEPDFEGENSDTYRNIIREFFQGKCASGSFDWEEEELFEYFQINYEFIPVVCFCDFWARARKSPKGKLNWVDYLESISSADWADYTRLVRTKLMTGSLKKNRNL